MREIKNNPQVYTTQKGKEEIKTNPQVYTTQKGKKEIKNDPQVYTTQEGKEIKGRSNIITRTLNPLHPNISVHILQTDLSTFPVAMTRRILFDNQELLKLVIISIILTTLTLDSRVIL